MLDTIQPIARSVKADARLVYQEDQPRDCRRVAIVHYWLVGMRGGERVLERLLRLYPQAEIFTHVYDPSAVSELIRSRKVHTSFIQRLPGAKRRYKQYLPLMPLALEHFDMTGFDLVISSESGPAKGVLVPPDTFHLCYCHSPMRYLWDQYHDYRATAGFLTRAAMPFLLHRLRTWDAISAQRIDTIASNSTFVRDRIRKSWGREAQVIHPPVEVSEYRVSDEIDNRYLWVGQFTRYKRPDIVVDAFNRLGHPLLMVGEGELAEQLRRIAQANIEIVSRLDYAKLKACYARSKALIFSAEEDFGIVPVEAMASGRPVIAYGRGGVKDTVVPGQTGLFFREQTADALIEAIERLDVWLPDFDPAAAVANASRFAPEFFDRAILNAIPRP